MPGRSTQFYPSGVEWLEERGLLSVLAASPTDRVDSTAASRRAVDVGKPGGSRDGGRSPSGESSGAAPSRTVHTSGESADSATAVRGSLAGASVSRRPLFQPIATRGLLDPLPPPTKPSDPTPADEVTQAGAEATGPIEEGVYVPMGATSVVGLSQSVASITFVYGTDVYDRPGGRTQAGTTSAAESVAPPRPSEPRGAMVVPAGEDLAVLAIPEASGDREAEAPGWRQLLDGALNPDWEAIDRDMRQLLGRLGDLAKAPDGPRSARAWLLWIGAATMLYVSQRASAVPRRLFRRAGRWAADPPIPDGPWPLGPP